MAKPSETTSVQIVCPIYNEGKNVEILVDRLASEGIQFDVLRFVYDRDDDTSLPFIEKMHETDSRIVADKNTFGPGVVKALSYAFSTSKPGPVIVVMGDNSDKLSIIPEMIEMWQNGSVLVSPSRYMKGGIQHGGPPFKTFLSRTAGKILYFCGFPTADATNNFKLYDGAWLSGQKIESVGGFEIALELCYRAFCDKKKIQELPTEWYDREEGESRFKLWSWMPRYLRWYIPLLSMTLKRRVGI